MGRTNKDAAYLEKLRAYFGKHQVIPTYEEMRQLLGMSSKSSVHKVVQRLIASGHLVQAPGARLAPGAVFHQRPGAASPSAAAPDAAEGCTGPCPAEQRANSTDSALVGEALLIAVDGVDAPGLGIAAGEILIVSKARPDRSGQLVAAALGERIAVLAFDADLGAPVRMVPEGDREAIQVLHHAQLMGVVIGKLERLPLVPPPDARCWSPPITDRRCGGDAAKPPPVLESCEPT